MRLDRLITLGLVQPLRKIAGRGALQEPGARSKEHGAKPLPSSPVARRLDEPAIALATAGLPPSLLPAPCSLLPVLMYHRISADPEPGVAPYYKVCTSPERFAEHMQWLADWGYRGVTLSAGLAALREQGAGSKEQGAKPEPTLTPSSPVAGRLDEPAIGLATAGLPHSLTPSVPQSLSPSVPQSHSPSPPHSQLSALSSQPFPKLVALTFDDGFRDFHTAAFPVLQRHGFTATMYLPTAFIGDERKSFKGHECLTWPEVKQLEAAGIEFGSHTVNHPRLVELDWPAIESELRDSQATLEERLGHPVRAFAYPFAFPSADRAFTTRFKQTLDTLGYETCATTEIGQVRPGDEPLQLKRLPANSADDSALLGAKLAGAYDWLQAVQWLFKQVKRTSNHQR